jgi:hypothetical protein
MEQAGQQEKIGSCSERVTSTWPAWACRHLCAGVLDCWYEPEWADPMGRRAGRRAKAGLPSRLEGPPAQRDKLA